MPRRPKRKNSDTAQNTEAGGGQKEHNQDPGRALIAVTQNYVAACCGATLNVYHRKLDQKVFLQDPGLLNQPIRVVQISPDQHKVLAGGDDRKVYVWDLETGNLLLHSIAAKKVSAASFTPDSRHVVFADKGGDVYAVEVSKGSDSITERPELIKPDFLLAHFSTIITSLSVSSCGTRLTTADREGKIRVTKLSKDLTQLAASIQSFALGHTAFVTTVCDVQLGDRPAILSAAGDGSIRLWDRESGAELDTFQAPSQEAVIHRSGDSDQHRAGPLIDNAREHQDLDQVAQHAHGSEGEPRVGASGRQAEPELNVEDSGSEASETEGDKTGERDSGVDQVQGREKLPPAVLQVVYSSGTFAACVEGDSFVRTFRVSEDCHLQPSISCALPGLTLPNSLAFDERGHLWGVAGVEGQIPFHISVLLRHQLLPEDSCEQCAHTDESAEGVCTDRLAQILNANHVGDRPPSVASELLPGTQISLELRKWVISEDERERRKRNRSDMQKQRMS